MHLNPGETPPTLADQEHAAALLFRLKDENPRLSRDELIELFMDEVDHRQRLAVFKYFCGNILSYAQGNRSRPWAERKAASMEKAKAAQAADANSLALKLKNVVLMDLLLPNGRRLRDATFADCTRAQGWFLKVARKGKPTQIVGKVLTEADLQAIK